MANYRLFFILLQLVCLKDSDAATRVKYGTVSTEIYPFMTYVTYPIPGSDMDRTCGGSLIAPNWVLTAGHCVVDVHTNVQSPDNSIKMYFGSNTVFSGFQVNSQKVIPYPMYNPMKNNNFDIALIKLTQNVPAQYATTIALPAEDRDNDFAGYNVLAIGWGLTEDGQTSQDLREGYLTLQSRAECFSFRNNNSGDKKLCVFIENAPGNVATGSGDSGGPILLEQNGQLVQIGLVSYGSNVIVTNGNGDIIKFVQNDIFTAVAAYSDWIQDTIAQN